MDSSFFNSKRPWSHYKDYLLQSYLEPYIPKVATLSRPIILVDCFAGRGKFADGENGSPLFIAEVIRRWRQKGVEITGQFIEADDSNFQALEEAIQEHSQYCSAKLGSFDANIPVIVKLAKRNTVFLYIDPYTVKGLAFDRMKSVYDQIKNSGSSIEVLMNFNVAIFMRWALAAMKRNSDLPNEAFESLADDPNESVERQTLSGIAGGDYWIEIASNDSLCFSEKLQAFLAEYVNRMSGAFQYVYTYAVKERYHHSVPKYVMVFATRHRDGALLMNDFMCKARRSFVESSLPKDTLFDLTPAEEIVDPAELDDAVLSVFSQQNRNLTRRDVQIRLMGNGFFARLTTSEINKTIIGLLKQGRLFSSTGKTRINDNDFISNSAIT